MARRKRAPERDRERGKNLAELRRSVGVRQEQAAAHFGLSPQQISKYERGIDQLSASLDEEMRAYYAATKIAVDAGFSEEQAPFAVPVTGRGGKNVLASGLDEIIRLLDEMKLKAVHLRNESDSR